MMTVTLYIEKDKKSDYKDIMGIQVGDLKFTRQEKEDIEEFFKHAAEEIYNQYQVMLKDIYKPGNIKFIYYPKKETKSTIKNLKYYETCRDIVLDGTQITLQNSSYTLGKSLQGASNVGKIRTNQEDSYLILEHPKNSNIKLLAVADGVGGRAGGEQASNYLLKEIIPFFEMIPEKYLEDSNCIAQIMEDKLYRINQEIVKTNLGGTTLSMAIKLQDETIIFNAGDSRVYTYSKKGLKQETKDDSTIQELYDMELIESEDLMRFHRRSNEITNSFGIPHLEVRTKAIPNSYDQILIASDGVTDCLSKEEIEQTITTSKKDNIANEIVERALETNSYCDPINRHNPNYYSEIKGGKDNTTAVLLKIR